MSTPDERLSDLLAQRARQGSGIHPTREGVDVALTRRAARRRRRRTVVTGLAGLCLMAGVIGGLALAGDGERQDERQEDGIAAPPGSLPEVPVVGLDIDDFELTSAAIAPVADTEDARQTVVAFRSGRSLADPILSVSVGHGELRGDPVDLDGDGEPDGGIGGNETGLGISWRLSDGSLATIGTTVELEQAALDYAREVYARRLDLDGLPNPAGLPERDTWTFPDPRGPDQSTVTYATSAGSGPRIVVSTTNQPGSFDRLQDATALGFGGAPFEEVALGSSFLGPGRAIVRDAGNGASGALALTDSGLTIELSAESVAVDDLRALLVDGAFVEVEPTDGPPTTTVVATASTIPPVTSTSTSVVPAAQGLPIVTRTVDERGEHLTIEFDGVPPALGAMALLESLTGDCARFEADFERIFQENGDEPYWQGWLTVELETSLIGIAGPVFGGPALGSAEDPGYIYCEDGANPAVIAVPVANLGEPTVTPLSGRPAIVIDIPD